MHGPLNVKTVETVLFMNGEVVETVECVPHGQRINICLLLLTCNVFSFRIKYGGASSNFT